METEHQTRLKSTISGQPRAVGVVLIGLSGLVLVALSTFAALHFISDQSAQTASVSEAMHTIDTAVFDELHLEARAVYVWDVREGRVLYEHNAEAQLPLASITKLMTALVASSSLPPEALVAIGSDALSQDGNSGFALFEQFRASDLLAFTMLESSNDGAYALASAAGGVEHFVEAMNGAAAEIGLTQTYFSNPTGLDTTTRVSGGYGSARDVAMLMEYALEYAPAAIESTRFQSLSISSLENASYDAQNTNVALGDISGLIASKTGFTDLAGGNLVVAFDTGLNHPVIVVVLGSTEEGRFRDVKKLVTASHEALREMHLAASEEEVQ